MDVVGRLAGLLFPDECRLCQTPLAELARYPVCSSCLRSVEPLSAEFSCAACRTPFLSGAPLDANGLCALCRLGHSGFDAAYSFGFYDGALRRLIHLFKYERIPALAGPLGRLLARALPRDQRFDCVTALPLHWRRRWSRGFNQAELLAREIARKTNLPYQDALRRQKHTPAQAGLTNAARRGNVRGAFAVRKRVPVEGRRILLVDDVLTTGATAGAAAATLKRAGASRVVVLTLARADRRGWMEDLGKLREMFQAQGAS